MTRFNKHLVGSSVAASALCLSAAIATADIVQLDDVIIQFSLCVGNDCSNGESFGFDTVRLKENNVRIHFDDTSTSASFPSNDWRITINDSANGGTNHFSVEDSTAGRSPFRIEAGASANALVIEADSDIGIGTLNPVVELHVVDGDSPTLRLEQDGSSGFTPQTFDLVSNEANFFIRDVTNGSQLPFRIKPGADTDALFIAADNDIGVGTDSPTSALHVRRTDGTAQLTIEETSAGFSQQLRIVNNGAPRMEFDNSATTDEVWHIGLADPGDDFLIRHESTGGGAGNVFRLSSTGDLTVTGSLTTATQTVPDYVFEDSYELMPLTQLAAYIEDNGHLPRIPSAVSIANNDGQYNMTKMQMSLLEKIEELTLYTLAQQDAIANLQNEIELLQQ